MNVLSLFDGMSCGRIALDRAGADITKYYASEIDKYASQISEHNYPEIIRLGDITKWKDWNIDWSSIDLLIAGFPCQAWSVAGKQKGDKDPRGALVHDLIAIWNKCKEHNPDLKFLFENVKMKKEFIEYINGLFGVEPIEINSALVSAQNRKRLYWTNINGIHQPDDKGILLRDIIGSGEVDRDKSLMVTTRVAGATEKRYKEKSMDQMIIQRQRGFNKGGLHQDKCPTLTSNSWEHNNHLLEFVDRDKAHCIDANCAKGGFEKHRRQLVFRPCKGRVGSLDGACKHVADATDIKGHDSLKRVCAESGKSPTLTTMGGGHREPKILVSGASIKGRRLRDRGLRDDYNKDVPITQCLEVKKTGGDKSNCLTTVQKDNVLSALPPGRYPDVYNDMTEGLQYRKLTPLECERLQTLPEGYTLALNNEGKQVVSNSQRYKAIGNGWTVDVIAHIFRNISPKKK